MAKRKKIYLQNLSSLTVPIFLLPAILNNEPIQCAFTFKIVIIFHLFPSVNSNASANLLANRRKFLYAIDVQHYIKCIK